MQSNKVYYNEIVFRSTLEAMWAVFFDNIGVKWMYEPHRVTLDNGRTYLPDFYLPKGCMRDINNTGLYIEIKSRGFQVSQFDSVGHNFPYNLALFPGKPAEFTAFTLSDYFEGGYQFGKSYNTFDKTWSFDWDDEMFLFQCKECFTIKADFNEGNYNYCPSCGGDPRPYMGIAAEKSYKTFYRTKEKINSHKSRLPTCNP